MCKPTYSLCSVHPEAVPGTALAAGKGSSFGSLPEASLAIPGLC